jgi:chemotaxis protein methyltransferase CheR
MTLTNSPTPPSAPRPLGSGLTGRGLTTGLGGAGLGSAGLGGGLGGGLGSSSRLAGADIEFLAAFIRQHSAIVVDPTKEYLLTTRLSPVAKEHGLDGISGIVAALRRSPIGALKDAVIDAMTTNETSFFRDQAPFDAFRLLLTQHLQDATASVGTVRVWCAACSSGQEPYSVALTAREVLSNNPGWRVRILATDISAAMVERTKAGRFSSLEINRGLPATRLVTDFTQVGRDWQANSALRSMMETRVLNLDAPFPALPPMDVVFLRNVLIYFDTTTKEQVLRRVAAVMKPGAHLLLGGAETTLGMKVPFERTTVGRAPVYRRTDERLP